MIRSTRSLAFTVLLVFLVILGGHAVMQQFLGWHPQGTLNLLINIVIAVVVTAWRHP